MNHDGGSRGGWSAVRAGGGRRPQSQGGRRLPHSWCSCLCHMAAGSRRYPGGGCRRGVELRAESAHLSDCASVCRAGCLGGRDRAARADRSFDRPGSWLIGQAAVVSATVGLAIFGVESTSEGLALPELARPLRTSSPLNASNLFVPPMLWRRLLTDRLSW